MGQTAQHYAIGIAVGMAIGLMLGNDEPVAGFDAQELGLCAQLIEADSFTDTTRRMCSDAISRVIDDRAE